MGNKKTLLVGLDAACWEYLNPLLQAGRLPALQQLIDSGTSGIVDSTMPAVTPVAWSSIVTGKNPAKHGIFDFMWRVPGTYEFVPIDARKRVGTPFWKYLNQHEIPVGLVNIPFTYPPDPINGFLVAGFGTPNSASNITYPSDVLSWIERRFGSYEPWLRPLMLKNGTVDEKSEADIKHQARQAEIAVELAARYQVEVLVINLMVPDHANHMMPRMDQVEQAICQTDSHLNILLQKFSPDNIMVISDHGSRRVKGDFLLLAWLQDHGYHLPVQRTPSERSDALNWALIQWLQVQHGWSGPQEKILRHLAKRVIPWISNGMADRFWKGIEQDIPFAYRRVLMSNQTDYTQTTVFPGGRGSGTLYFNLLGREPAGVISTEEQDTLSAELAEKLSEIMEPETNQPLYSNIYTSEMLYSGSFSEHAPSLILDDYDSRWSSITTYPASVPKRSYNKYFAERHNNFGEHSRKGIFVFSGPAFIHDSKICEGHIMDIPATLLHLHGIPIPEDYDGRVLTEVMDPNFMNQNPVTYQQGDPETLGNFDHAYSTQESDELLEHLRSLGYVD